MATKKDTKTQSDKPLLNNDPDYYDPKKSDISERAVEAAKTELGVAVGDAERKAEAALPSPVDPNGELASLYNKDAIQQSRYQNIVQSVRMASNWKKGAGAGGFVAIIAGIMFFFSFLTTFQLVGLIDQLDSIFDAQGLRVLNKRAAMHYAYAIDEDGVGYYRKDIPEDAGRLKRGFANVDPNKMRAELAKSNIVIGVDSNGRATLNGKLLEGKLSDQRNQLKQVIDKKYDQERWIKRNARAKAAYKAAGIKRVFFMENTRSKFNNWELEMINRLRERISGADSSANSRILTDADAERQAAADAELEKLTTDPSYDPGRAGTEIGEQMAEAAFKNINLKSIATSIGSSVGGAVKIDGVASLACDIKHYSKGIEYAAIAVRHAALLRHAGTFQTAAHQMKEGLYVTSEQVSALMLILNRKPGIGASGAWQMLNGNKDAKVKYSDSLALSFSGTKGGGGALAQANQAADAVFDGISNAGVPVNGYCTLSRNPFYQVGSAVVGIGYLALSVVGTPFTGGASTALAGIKIAGSVALSGAFELAKATMQPILVRMLQGPLGILNYSESQGGDYNMDALVFGKNAMASGFNYQNGMTSEQTPEQLTETQNIIAQEKADSLKKMPLTTRYLSINNTDSLLFKTLMGVPNSPKAVASTSLTKITDLPKSFANSLSLLTPQGKAKAESISAPYFANNPGGIKQYGWSEAQLQQIMKVKPVDNEDEIINQNKLDAYKEWRDKCFNKNNATMYFGYAMTEDEESTLENCRNLDDPDVLMFARYQLDRAVQTGILFNFRITDCNDPDADDWDCPYVSNIGDVAAGNDNSVEPQSIEYSALDLTQLLAKYTNAPGFVNSLDTGKNINFDDNSCDQAWSEETVQSIETPVEWDKSSHFCWPSSVYGKAWTPQGISGSSSTSDYAPVANRNILLTSWYSEEEELGYTQKRSSDEMNSSKKEVNRFMAVDVDNKKYVEIELVVPCKDEPDEVCALGNHASGLSWLGEKAILAYGYGFYTFELSNLREDGSGNLILPASGRWSGVGLGLGSGDKDILISSNTSVDKSANQIISSGWSPSLPLKIYRWNLNSSGTDFASADINTSVNHEYSTIVGVQGIASYNGITYANSSNADGESGGIGGVLYFWKSFQSGSATGRRMPDGVVQNLYIDSSRDRIWSLTELKKYAGERQNYVFSIPLGSTSASLGTTSDDKVPAASVNPTTPGTQTTPSSCTDPNASTVYWPVEKPRDISNTHDISVSKRTPVYAITKGKVVVSEDLLVSSLSSAEKTEQCGGGRYCSEGYYSYGKQITIDHGISKGVVTYGHLDERLVEKDQTVAAGQLIGYSGNTGNSSGPHLHMDFNYYGSLTVYSWLQANSAIEPPCTQTALIYKYLNISVLPNNNIIKYLEPLVRENQYV